jgi:DUF1009 family protein
MPAIGPNTIAGIVAAGLGGIVVQAGATLAAQRGDMADAADEAGVFIAGMNAEAAGRVTKTAAADDASIGLAMLEALSGPVSSRGVVVVRRHVLAVETGEGLAALVMRAAARRQWGKSTKRRGSLALATLGDLEPAVITAAADAGYERIVAASDEGATTKLADDVRAAGLTLDLRRRGA